jgi:hypothetical protein
MEVAYFLEVFNPRHFIHFHASHHPSFIAIRIVILWTPRNAIPAICYSSFLGPSVLLSSSQTLLVFIMTFISLLLLLFLRMLWRLVAPRQNSVNSPDTCLVYTGWLQAIEQQAGQSTGGKVLDKDSGASCQRILTFWMSSRGRQKDLRTASSVMVI